MIKKNGNIWYDTKEIEYMARIGKTTSSGLIVKLNLLWRILSESDKKQYNKSIAKSIASRVIKQYLYKNHRSTEVLENRV